jgi:hypothetical protein
VGQGISRVWVRVWAWEWVWVKEETNAVVVVVVAVVYVRPFWPSSDFASPCFLLGRQNASKKEETGRGRSPSTRLDSTEIGKTELGRSMRDETSRGVGASRRLSVENPSPLLPLSPLTHSRDPFPRGCVASVRVSKWPSGKETRIQDG